MRHAAVASAFLHLVSVGLLTGCPYPPLDPLHGSEHKDLPLKVNRKIDLLFLIDDSPSMGDKQTDLANNFPKFIDVLSTIKGGLPDLHIGVATSDLGSKGAADSAPGAGIGVLGQGGCSGLGKNGDLQVFGASSLLNAGSKFIADTIQADGVTRQPNYTGKLSDVFAQMAHAGTGGCNFGQHLEAVKQALDPAHTSNAGFIRDDAYLAVIILADEDDCSMSHSSLIAMSETPLGPLQSFRCTRFGVLCDDSGATPDAMNQPGPKNKCHPSDDTNYLTKVANYAAFLKSLKTDPNNVIVAGIIGTPDPFAVELRVPSGGTSPIPALGHSCTYLRGDGKPAVADPPIRIKFFFDQFPDRSAFASICQQDLSGGLQQIRDLLETVMIGDPCIEGTLADVDPKNPGPQYDCEVSAVTGRGSPAESQTVLPRCVPEDSSAINQPCWHLATDPVSCPNSDHLILKIEGQATLSSDAHVIANCATQPN